MRILHYFLGFPPYRSGGLTIFAYDLMKYQVGQGHTVMALWPGRMGKKLSVHKGKDRDGIVNLELVAPLPVPLDEGIAEPEAFMTADAEKNSVANMKEFYERFLQEAKPDVIHLHTLMGLHKEFLEAAHALQIRVVMTTHDYFGLCFKTNMYYAGKNCTGDCGSCAECNAGGLPLRKIRLMQSPLYRGMKNVPLVKALRKQHRKRYFDRMESKGTENPVGTEGREAYDALREYYHEMLSLVDEFHFNSEIAKETYIQALALDGISVSGRVISITHAGIKDHRALRDPGRKELTITYLGPAKAEKGYYFLSDTVREAISESPAETLELETFPLGYDYSELPHILSESDVVVVPSLWRETYGFVVEEALSYGVPVLCSDTVGAKDLLADGGGAVFPSGDREALKNLLLSLDDERLDAWNREILNQKFPTMQGMAAELETLYKA